MFKIATWNVNSLKVRLSHVLQWLREHQPDILALQEIKLLDADFPLHECRQAGYECVFSGQKTYNGVAILSKKIAMNTVMNLPGLDDSQRRVLATTLDDIRIINLYVPNGESVASEKYEYKLKWLHHLRTWLEQELKIYSKIIVLGDFNIAPESIDVYDPAAWEGKVLFSDPERSAFREIVNLGFNDVFRLFEQPEQSFTWWDYRMNAFRRKMGLRIDHILISHALTPYCKLCYIDKHPRAWERPSDHAPVVAEFDYLSLTG